jgi:hypothetical protein
LAVIHFRIGLLIKERIALTAPDFLDQLSGTGVEPKQRRCNGPTAIVDQPGAVTLSRDSNCRYTRGHVRDGCYQPPQRGHGVVPCPQHVLLDLASGRRRVAVWQRVNAELRSVPREGHGLDQGGAGINAHDHVARHRQYSSA